MIELNRETSYVEARIEGESGEYALGFDPGAGVAGEWRCTCDASSKFHRECSHLIALQLVTTERRT